MASAQNLTSQIWISNKMDYTFPELTLTEVKNKPNVGVCFSGGGTRSMSATMGQLRALNKLNLIPKIRYISCVSGGSWASTIYTYAQGYSDEQLLGIVTPTEEITQSYLVRTLSKQQLAYGATQSLSGNIFHWSQTSVSWHDVWNYSVGTTYLQYFDLFDATDAKSHPDNIRYFSYDQPNVVRIKNANSQLNDKFFRTVRPNKPYLIVNSCILIDKKDTLGFEYTPLTVGRPFCSTVGERVYGGGFIEPFAFRGEAPIGPPTTPTEKQPLNSDGQVEVPIPDRPFALTETTGTSSAAFAKIASNVDVNEIDPQAFYWGINGRQQSRGQLTTFGDGGIQENYGIIPLIQRGVKTIIVFINTDTKLSGDYKPNNTPDDYANNPEGKCDPSLLGLFGYYNGDWSTGWKYPNNKVFSSDELYSKVIKPLQQLKAAQKPMIHTSNHITMANCSWGVKGGAHVSVTWCYLDRCLDWEDALPHNGYAQTQIKLGNEKPPSGDFEHFPNYKTVRQNPNLGLAELVQLTEQQVKLLADFTCASILMDSNHTIEQAINSATT